LYCTSVCADYTISAVRFRRYAEGAVTQSGCVIHYVTPEVDAGEVLAQEIVPIKPDDTLETFEARMHAVEHRLIVATLQQLCPAGTGDARQRGAPLPAWADRR
jgi:folate-dependent phosphoribosylglycinamide formyltransferase PurN